MSPATGGDAGEAQALSEENAKLAEEVTQLRDTVTRQRADFDNFRKRTLKEKDQIREAVAEDFVSKLLPVLDNFERAIQFSENAADATAVRDGVRMIAEQLAKTLEGEGLVKINALDSAFDPAEHDALAVDERDDIPENRVTEVMVPGYRLKDKVVRPAMVKVSKLPAEASKH
ncbi:MAG: nucleotide exchange factor GrpE [Candidatus Sumerlaeaceae bacterium]|nr:nucleotide exchange factor GrpE [Candidatus Sumerlaeaceae bacterium]